MITLQELFNTLSYGELSNLTLRQESSDALDEKYYPKIISHINMGLGKLYERFNLATNEFKLHLHADVTKYFLREDRSGILADMSDLLYLELAAGEVYPADFIKLLKAYDELSVELPLDDSTKTTSIKTLSHDVIIIPVSELGVQVVTLEYRAKYPKIILTPDLNPLTYELYIPDFIIEALLYYVASRIYKPTGQNTSDGNADKSTSYLQLYEMGCARIKANGLEIELNDSQQSFDNGGFV